MLKVCDANWNGLSIDDSEKTLNLINPNGSINIIPVIVTRIDDRDERYKLTLTDHVSVWTFKIFIFYTRMLFVR